MFKDLNQALGMKGPKLKRQPVAQSQKNEVLARQGNKCAKCDKMLDMRGVNFDHIKEVYKGGKSIVDNIQALCTGCHSIKTHDDRLRQTESKRTEKRDELDRFLFG